MRRAMICVLHAPHGPVWKSKEKIQFTSWAGSSGLLHSFLIENRLCSANALQHSLLIGLIAILVRCTTVFASALLGIIDVIAFAELQVSCEAVQHQ